MLALFTLGFSPCPRLRDKPELVLPFYTSGWSYCTSGDSVRENLWGAAGRSGYLGGCLPIEENKLDLYPHPFIGCFWLWRGGEGIQGVVRRLCAYIRGHLSTSR